MLVGGVVAGVAGKPLPSSLERSNCLSPGLCAPWLRTRRRSLWKRARPQSPRRSSPSRTPGRCPPFRFAGCGPQVLRDGRQANRCSLWHTSGGGQGEPCVPSGAGAQASECRPNCLIPSPLPQCQTGGAPTSKSWEQGGCSCACRRRCSRVTCGLRGLRTQLVILGGKAQLCNYSNKNFSDLGTTVQLA